MTETALRETPHTRTSAMGCMYRPALDATFAVLIATMLPESATATSTGETIVLYSERTAAGPFGQIEHVPAESTAEAIMEIRRRSGLTWEELGDLFDVSRRSVHHWANGKPVTASHDRTIRRMLAAVRHLDQGDQVGTRALLLAVDQAMGVSTLDLLKDGRFDEAMGRVAGTPLPGAHRCTAAAVGLRLLAADEPERAGEVSRIGAPTAAACRSGAIACRRLRAERRR